MKKSSLLFSSISITILGAVALTLHVTQNTNKQFFNRGHASDVTSSILFERASEGNNVHEYEYDDIEHWYEDVVDSSTIHGNVVKMHAFSCRAFPNNFTGIANLYYSEVSFQDSRGDEFHFQSPSGIRIALGVNVSTRIFIETSYDGISFQSFENYTNASGYLNYEFTNHPNYVRFMCGEGTEIPLNQVIIDYTCSYDYVESRKKVTIYSSNDFHGAVEDTGNEVGLEKFGSYFKDMGEQENTLLLDQGDTWQGSIYSNMNRGNLINEVMTEARFDARTIGNHDFDWGVDATIANKNRSYIEGEKDYLIPVLGANIYGYDFPNKQFTNEQKSNIAQKTVTYTLENGLKVGIVGVIGQDQITSINSLYTQDIGFKPHVPIIIEEATNLRNAGCDIVILSIHADEADVMGNGLENYVDLVLCGHSHQHEIDTENGLTYAQFYKNGTYFGKIELLYDENSGTVLSTNVTTIDKNYINNYFSEVDEHDEPIHPIDSTIHNLVSNGLAEGHAAGDVKVANKVVFANEYYGAGAVWVDSTDTRGLPYYTYNGSTWTQSGRIVQQADLGYYNYWYYPVLPDYGDHPYAGHYYLNYTDGNYYKAHFVGEDVVYGDPLGNIYGGNTPTPEKFGIGNSAILAGDYNYPAENLMAQAVYDQAIAEGYTDIICSYVNNARTNLSPTLDNTTGLYYLTYADIYRAFPFDNTVYIIEVTGREIMNEVQKYNWARFSPSFVSSGKKVSPEQTYKIACLDYLAFHTNSARYYDYFDQNNGAYVGTLSKNYREILRDWLASEGYNNATASLSSPLNKVDFNSNSEEFNRYNISTASLRATFLMNDGTSDVFTTVDMNNGDYVGNHLPGIPTRSGYVFEGWYQDSACTIPLGTAQLTSNQNFYAKWVVGYSTGRVTDAPFVLNSTSTTVQATNGVNNMNITLYHSPMQLNTTYNEFGISNVSNQGHITFSAPSGYKIATVELETYGQYDNLDFYKNTDGSGDPMSKNAYLLSNRCLYHLNVDSQDFYIKNYSNYNVWMYSIRIVLVANS